MDETPRDRYCLACSYNLRGVHQLQCPECGRAFEPEDTQTWSRLPFNPETRAVARHAIRLTAIAWVTVLVFIAVALLIYAVYSVLSLIFNW